MYTGRKIEHVNVCVESRKSHSSRFVAHTHVGIFVLTRAVETRHTLSPLFHSPSLPFLLHHEYWSKNFDTER